MNGAEMKREERLSEMSDEADKWFRPTGATNERPLVDWIPASAPVIQEVRRDLTRLADDPDTDSELRKRVRAVLSGDAKLSTLLESGGFPILKESELPRDARYVIDAMREGELK